MEAINDDHIQATIKNHNQH